MRLLVSCIMPTAGRPEFAMRAVQYFLAQTHPDRELVVVEPAPSALRGRLPSHPSIRHVVVRGTHTLGALRNLACQLSRGEVIAHWDDDDWHGPDRLARQVEPLQRGTADVTGLRGAPMLDVGTFVAWRCRPALHRRIFRQDVQGGTLVYRRHLWDRLAQYPDTSLAEDADFLELALRRGARLTAVPGDGLFVYVRHGGNTWSFRCGRFADPAGWECLAAVPLPAADRDFYRSRSDRSRRSAPRLPLVSCIMPTRDRPELAVRAVEYFRRQDYAAKELIVVDDGRDGVGELLPDDPAVVHHRVREPMVLGEKRNLACRLARGDIVAHWDDDDWIAPDRLRVQVAALQDDDADVCGAGALTFYDIRTRRGWRYTYPAGPSGPWVAGATLCYRRATWLRTPFPPVGVGEDTRFVLAAARRVADVRAADCVVAVVHGRNTAAPGFRGPCWTALPPEPVRRLLGADLDFYDRMSARV